MLSSEPLSWLYEFTRVIRHIVRGLMEGPTADL